MGELHHAEREELQIYEMGGWAQWSRQLLEYCSAHNTLWKLALILRVGHPIAMSAINRLVLLRIDN